jgi:hypothetical protein
MTPHQFNNIVASWGLTQEAAAEVLGVGYRTLQRYAAEGPPPPIAKLLRVMVEHNIKPEDLE